MVWSWVTMDLSDTSSDELEEHNTWNPMLELFFHAHIGVYMEVLVDEKELERIALSCQFALDILIDKSEVRRAQELSLAGFQGGWTEGERHLCIFLADKPRTGTPPCKPGYGTLGSGRCLSRCLSTVVASLTVVTPPWCTTVPC